MVTVNSLSGGKSSSYIAKEYPADYNVFALVRTSDMSCQYPDAKLRQRVEDKLGMEFIGTLEMDDIIKIMFDLEQFIGREISWVSGETFEGIIKKHGDYLPNLMARYCTTEMKMKPIFEWWQREINDVCVMNIGLRYGEQRRVKKIRAKLNKDGIDEYHGIIGRKNNRNKWAYIPWRIPLFPLVTDRVLKDNIDAYWVDKPVPFHKGYYNNCVGCFHKSPLLLSLMNKSNAVKMKWFAEQEARTGHRFRSEVSYAKINSWNPSQQLSWEDFSDCDSGYCGL